MTTYGNNLLKQHFLLKEGLHNFNHGSFGTVPKVVMDAAVGFLYEQESFPDEWFRERYFVLLNESRSQIAELIKASVDDVVMLENASYAVNSVLRSFPFQRGDKVLVFCSAYRMVLDTLLFLGQSVGVEVVKVDIPYPLDSEQTLVDLVKSKLECTVGVKMCIFSHISSMPTMIEPVQALTAISKAHGCVVMIDGAHAPGILDIDVAAIGADLYTGNCHKWLFAPKGCAFLWASAEYRARFVNSPQPAVVSSTGWYDFVGRFAYTGTRDYTAAAALPAALQFVKDALGGRQAAMRYCTDLLREGCELLVREWGTSYLVPPQMHGVMANVLLPLKTLDQAAALQRTLHKEYNIFVVVGDVCRRAAQQDEETDRIAFVRISAQVYLEMEDFALLARTVRVVLGV